MALGDLEANRRSLGRFAGAGSGQLDRRLAMLGQITDGVAEIAAAGTVNGAVGGVATEIELKAKYRFDISSRRGSASGATDQGEARGRPRGSWLGYRGQADHDDHAQERLGESDGRGLGPGAQEADRRRFGPGLCGRLGPVPLPARPPLVLDQRRLEIDRFAAAWIAASWWRSAISRCCTAARKRRSRWPNFSKTCSTRWARILASSSMPRSRRARPATACCGSWLTAPCRNCRLNGFTT